MAERTRDLKEHKAAYAMEQDDLRLRLCTTYTPGIITVIAVIIVITVITVQNLTRGQATSLARMRWKMIGVGG